jgi:predicted amidohydrolase
MSDLVVAAAQTRSVKGDVEANVRIHVAAVETAVRERARLVVFPELSLTGYEPELAAALTLAVEDARLRPLQELARRHEVTIVAGAPVASRGTRPHLGALIWTPTASHAYAKRHLHPGEERHFEPGREVCLVDVDGERVGIAICADIGVATHSQELAERGATLYAAGVLVSEPGYAVDARLLETYAARHAMAVLMANHSAPTGGWTPAGRSALWDETGRRIAAAEGTPEALIVGARGVRDWTGHVVPL